MTLVQVTGTQPLNKAENETLKQAFWGALERAHEWLSTIRAQALAGSCDPSNDAFKQAQDELEQLQTGLNKLGFKDLVDEWNEHKFWQEADRQTEQAENRNHRL